MNCPHCKKKISDKEISHYLASKGGRKSRRTLTPDQARAMVAARENKKKAEK